MKQLLTSTLSLLLLLATLTGCVREFEYDCPATGTGNEVQVSFHVETSAASTVPTRALIQTTPEMLIRNFVVIAFDKDDKFAYYKEVAVTDPGKVTPSFTVGVISSANDADKYSFVVIANVAASTLGLPDIEKGDQTKTELLASLYHQNTELMGSGTYLPMSSPSTQKVKVVEGLKFNQAEKGNTYEVIRLVRITARVDMKIGSAITGKYRLKTVMLYDFNDRGSMWNAALNVSTTLTNPLIPTDAEIINGPLSVTLDEGGTEFTSKLYMFEAGVADKTCLVVGLERSIDNGATWVDADNDGKPDVDYFKVLFAKKDASDIIRPFDVVRNHRYEFTITGVNGNGFKEPEDAYKSVIAGMDVDIIDWDEANMNVVVTDGIHILSVTPGEITLPKDEVTYTDGFNLLIATDFELQNNRNWWAEFYADEEGTIQLTGADKWLSLEVTQGDKIYDPKDENTKTLVRLKANANTGADRIAWIHIKTRVLNFKVKVTQLDYSPAYVWITDEEGNDISSLSFSSENPVQKKFKVTWSPKAQPLQIQRIPGADAFTYTDSDGTSNWTEIPAYRNGSYTFTITPVSYTGEELEENPFKATSTTLQFAIGDGRGNISEASINLRQMDYKIVLSGFKSGYYGMIVTDANIKANARWKAEIADPLERARITNLPVTSGNANIAEGTDFKYTFDDSGNYGPVTFKFTSPDGLFEPKYIEVTLGSITDFFAKSNIVMKNGKLTFAESHERNRDIPANSQGIWFKAGSLFGQYMEGENEGLYTPDAWIVYNPTGANIVGINNVPHVYREISIPSDMQNSNYDAYIYMYPKSAFTHLKNHNGGYDETKGVGDICRYMSDKGMVDGYWRIPTQREFELLANESTSKFTYPQTKAGVLYGDCLDETPTGNSDGNYGLYKVQSGLLTGFKILEYSPDLTDNSDLTKQETTGDGLLYLPFSGYLYIFSSGSSSGRIVSQGTMAYYWTSSRSYSYNGHFAKFTQGYYGFSEGPWSTGSIRCIRADNYKP